MSFTIEEKTEIEDDKVTVSLDTTFRNDFTSIIDLVSTFNISLIECYERDKVEDLVILRVETTKKPVDYSVAISEGYINEFIDKTIRLLETDEKYEMCGIFLRVKNKLKDHMTNDK